MHGRAAEQAPAIADRSVVFPTPFTPVTTAISPRQRGQVGLTNWHGLLFSAFASERMLVSAGLLFGHWLHQRPLTRWLGPNHAALVDSMCDLLLRLAATFVRSSTVPDSRPGAGTRVEKGVWNSGGIRVSRKKLMPESSRLVFYQSGTVEVVSVGCCRECRRLGADLFEHGLETKTANAGERSLFQGMSTWRLPGSASSRRSLRRHCWSSGSAVTYSISMNGLIRRALASSSVFSVSDLAAA